MLLKKTTALPLVFALSLLAVPLVASAQRGPQVRPVTQKIRPGTKLLPKTRRPLTRPSATMRARMQIEKRMARQMGRIHYGMMDGSLTWREASKLFKGQRQVERKLVRAMADRRLLRYELIRIDRLQDRQSTLISALRHNRQTRRALPTLSSPPPVSKRMTRPHAPTRRIVSPPPRPKKALHKHPKKALGITTTI